MRWIESLETIKISSKVYFLWRHFIISLDSLFSWILHYSRLTWMTLRFDCFFLTVLDRLGFPGDIYTVLTSTGMVLICVCETRFPLVCSQYSEKLCVCWTSCVLINERGREGEITCWQFRSLSTGGAAAEPLLSLYLYSIILLYKFTSNLHPN